MTIADPSRYADHQLYLQYDPMNRPTAKYYGAAHRSAGTADVRFYYDNTYMGDADAGSSRSWGKLRAAEVTVQGQGESKANGHSYVYEARGLLTQEVVTTTYTTRPYTMDYTYDVGGRATGMSYPNAGTAETVSMGYNTQRGGLPNQLSSSVGGPYPVYSATYNAKGQMVSMQQGSSSPTTDNLFTSYTYDDNTTKRGWLTGTLVRSAGGGTTYLNMSMGYTANGNVAQVQQTGDGTLSNPSFTNLFQYDGFNRLTSAISSGTTTIFASESYAFDSIGRMTTRTVGGTSYNYTYADTAHRDAPTQYGSRPYSYDAVGNQVSAGTGQSGQGRTYDAENRLVSMSLPGPQGGSSANFVYNAGGQRIIKSTTASTGQTTRTLYIGSVYEEDISPPPPPTPTSTNTPTSTPTSTSTATSTATPTASPSPTNTPTPVATDTPADTPTQVVQATSCPRSICPPPPPCTCDPTPQVAGPQPVGAVAAGPQASSSSSSSTNNTNSSTAPYTVYYSFGGKLVGLRRANQPDPSTNGQYRIVGICSALRACCWTPPHLPVWCSARTTSHMGRWPRTTAPQRAPS